MHDNEHSVVVIDPGSPAIGDQGKASSILAMTPSTLAVTLTTARWGGGPVAARRVPGCLLALLWVAAVAAFRAYAGILKLDFFAISDTPEVHNAQSAYEHCTDAGRTAAEVPAAAQFPAYRMTSPDINVARSGSGPYTVRSIIDVQTATGAMVRHHYTCEVSSDSDNGVRISWRLDN